MEAKTVHTATPFSFKTCESDPTIFQLLDANGKVIGFLRRGTGGRAEANEFAANAAFIVRACNSHQALIEALKSAIALIAEVARIRSINTDSLTLCSGIVKCGKDALAAAEQS